MVHFSTLKEFTFHLFLTACALFICHYLFSTISFDGAIINQEHLNNRARYLDPNPDGW
jgi:hypothetical protein